MISYCIFSITRLRSRYLPNYQVTHGKSPAKHNYGISHETKEHTYNHVKNLSEVDLLQAAASDIAIQGCGRLDLGMAHILDYLLD